MRWAVLDQESDNPPGSAEREVYPWATVGAP